MAKNPTWVHWEHRAECINFMSCFRVFQTTLFIRINFKSHFWINVFQTEVSFKFFKPFLFSQLSKTTINSLIWPKVYHFVLFNRMIQNGWCFFKLSNIFLFIPLILPPTGASWMGSPLILPAQDPSQAQLFYMQLDHIPFPFPLESLFPASPFPFYFLSFSAPHLPSPNPKPIQHVKSLNSAIATSPPCRRALLQMPTPSPAAALFGQPFMCS